MHAVPAVLVLVALVAALRRPPAPSAASSESIAAPASAPVPPPRSRCPVDLSDLPTPPPSGEEIVFVSGHGSLPGLPTVRGQLRGCSFAMLVDTGVSAGNVMMGWFARRLGLQTRPGKMTAFDIAGRSAGLLETDRFDLLAVGIDTMVAIKFVDPTADRLREDGIAVVLSPLFAVADGRVLVLELGPRSRMHNVSAADAESLFHGPSTFDVRDCDGSFEVAAVVEGVPARLAVDTGSMVSVLYSGSPAGRPIAARVERWEQAPETALGGPQDKAAVPGIRTTVGPLSVVMPFEVMRAQRNMPGSCGFDGVLGVDFFVAHRCSLLVDVARMRGYCAP